MCGRSGKEARAVVANTNGGGLHGHWRQPEGGACTAMGGAQARGCVRTGGPMQEGGRQQQTGEGDERPQTESRGLLQSQE
jgi:hypothetical protein